MPQDKQLPPEQPGDKARETAVGNDGLSGREDVSRAAAPKDLADAERRRTFKSTGSFDPEQEMSIEIDMGNGQTASRRSKSDPPFDIAAASKRDEERRLEAIRANHPSSSGEVLQAGLIYDESPLKYSGVRNADDVVEKLSGAAEGLAEAFNEGIAAAAKDPNLVNRGLADTAKTVTSAGAYVADKAMNQDWDGVTRDAEKVVQQVADASDKYSAMSQHGQGKVIGKYFMPAFTPDLPGMVQEAKTLGKSEKVLAETETTMLAGKGGDWSKLNERPAAEVVRQIHPLSCVSACGEMLSDGALKQKDLIEKLGTPCDVMDLADHLGKDWTKNRYRKEAADWIIDRAPLGVTLIETPPQNMRYFRIPPVHAVVVDGFDHLGNIKIRDPEKGLR